MLRTTLLATLTALSVACDAGTIGAGGGMMSEPRDGGPCDG